MEINIKDIGVQDAAAILENLALIGQNSEDLDTSILESLFEVIGSLATAIRQEMEAAA